MEITQEYILGISPDASSTKNANKIFSTTKWSVYRSDRAVWCEIYGSGKKPYLTQLDIQNIAFKCSCPSRKFPCKHSLALGLYIADRGLDTIGMSDEPLWVKEWIDKRVAKAQKQTTTPKVKSQESIKKLEAKRWSSAKENVSFVADWLADSIKLGILDLPNRDYGYWEDLKKRMVDLKLVGFNRFFTKLQNLNYAKSWESEAVYVLSDMHQLVASIKNYQYLDSEFKAELAMLLGWSSSKKELLAQNDTKIVNDMWIVVNIHISYEDRLKVRKVYLYGVESNCFAYILDFVPESRYFEELYTKSTMIKAQLVFYDGVIKQRAIIKTKESVDRYIPTSLKSVDSLHEAYSNFKEALISFPWVWEYPVFVSSCSIVSKDDEFYIVDRFDNLVALGDMDIREYQRFLILSDGEFVDMFILYRREYATVLGFIYDDKVVSL